MLAVKAIFAGTFDPPTLGHWEIIQRAHPLFEKFYIVLALNSVKNPLLSVLEREEVLKKLISKEGLQNKCEVLSSSELVAKLSQKLKVDYLVRGVRSGKDLEHELPMSVANEILSRGMTTILIPSTKESTFVSSTLVREIYGLGGDVSQFVPGVVAEFLNSKNKSKNKSKTKVKGKKK
jgi:pantetheine-phosphate adenylyltransferase